MSTVKKHKKEYNNVINMGNSPAAMTSPGRFTNVAVTFRTMILSQGCRSLLTQTPQIAPELEASATLVRIIVKEDLQYKSYGIRKGQFMSEATVGEGTKAPEPPKAIGKRRFGLLAAQTAIPSTIMSGASLKGMLIKPPHNTKESLITKIMNVFANILQYLVNIVTKNYLSVLFLSMFL